MKLKRYKLSYFITGIFIFCLSLSFSENVLAAPFNTPLEGAEGAALNNSDSPDSVYVNNGEPNRTDLKSQPHRPGSIPANSETLLPDAGPGGPILVVTTTADPFSTFFAEILRTEGLNAFATADITAVDATLLNNYDVVILGEMALTPSQVTILTDWVTAGGNLIVMRPDKQLASLLGLTDASSTLAEAYLLVDTASAPGQGIVGETIQFHGTADLYTTNGATVLATLYSDATTATSNPALSLVSVGTNGGQAAAFTYDLAKSVIYTRQGNPDWRDIDGDGTGGPVRADDMFHNGSDPDWVDLDKVAIPQADEQQRLLVNLILEMNLDNMPLPRFWYFPRGEKAVVVMTSDDHASGNVADRFEQLIAFSPEGCSVDDWECIRSSVYIYPDTYLTEEQANAYHALGFEIGVHVNTGCADYTLTGLENYYSTQLAEFATRFPGLPLQDSERTHCIAWSGWGYQPDVKEQEGIRLDTNYYFWPPDWVNDQPGLFTGSGMPMRFADLDGSMFDVYQATTQMTDESGQSYPYTIDTLISRAVGPEGYYGVFTTNMHTDVLYSAGSDAIIASAQSNGVPVVSGRQLLTWLDGRNSSSFANLSWSADTLSFETQIGTGANGLQVMVPAQSSQSGLTAITINSVPITYTMQTIKGVSYAIFEADIGQVNVSYGGDITPPTVLSTTPADGASGIAADTIVSATFDEAMDATTIDTTTFILRDSTDTAVPASVSYAGNTATLTPDSNLQGGIQYTATISGTITDLAGNPLGSDVTWNFTTAPGAVCVTIDVVAGWNLVSVPVEAPDMSLITLFPDISLPAYSYEGVYQAVAGTDLLENGKGYWMNFDSPQSYEVCGQVSASTQIPVNAGWNLIGAFDTAVAVSAITSTPTDILVLPVYGYDGIYTEATSLTPGNGYWVLVNQAGTLTMDGGGP